MLASFISNWWSWTSTFFSAPFALASGRVSIFTILPTVGLAFLVIGLILALAWREKQARWLALPFAAAVLVPIVLNLANAMMGWFGVLFFLVLGGVALLAWVGVIASDARRRLPVWLIGLSFVSYVVYCGMVIIALIWGVA